jgi:hypothetical protein
MKVEIYYCDICKKEVGHNDSKLYSLVMEIPFGWTSKMKYYSICSDCIKKVEKLIDSIEQGAE